jgi:hypothetical protein
MSAVLGLKRALPDQFGLSAMSLIAHTRASVTISGGSQPDQRRDAR